MTLLRSITMLCLAMVPNMTSPINYSKIVSNEWLKSLVQKQFITNVIFFLQENPVTVLMAFSPMFIPYVCLEEILFYLYYCLMYHHLRVFYSISGLIVIAVSALNCTPKQLMTATISSATVSSCAILFDGGAIYISALWNSSSSDNSLNNTNAHCTDKLKSNCSISYETGMFNTNVMSK